MLKSAATSRAPAPTYNAQSCFEASSLPADVRAHSERIARAAQRLVQLHDVWLAHAHDTLDAAVAAAVAAAHGWADWSAAVADQDFLRRLLALNRERAGPPG